MTTITNGESGLSVRNKLNDIWAGLELNAYDTSIASTAVDVFVYDTSKDSDGGAWRKRTQHTSWYNETLNTATRGSRREFPAVAVIVAEANKITIYDGDDPSLPMWMVFGSGAPGIRGSNAASSVKAVSMHNGLLVAATSGAGVEYQSGLPLVNFLSDRFSLIRGAAIGEIIVGTVEERNSASSVNGDDSIRIASGYVNDVAMTVLPDAPIDPATGLPVPTIAVATDGGVSVIKDDGTVVDSAETSVNVAVAFDAQNNLHYTRSGQTSSFASDYQSDGFGSFIDSPLPSVGFVLTNSVNGLDAYRNTRTRAADQGLELIEFNPNSIEKSLTANTTSTYNTGWMNGDIKGAFLSDTDDTDLVGSGELVTNGTFDTDLTGWTASSGLTATVVSGEAVIENTSGGRNFYTLFSLAEGSHYHAEIVVSANSGSSNFRIGTSVGSEVNGARVDFSAAGTYQLDFTAKTTGTFFLTLTVGGTTGNGMTVDNISVKLADADRSVNNNGLIVNGTVTRTFVDEV
jgi:hypothetical protein